MTKLHASLYAFNRRRMPLLWVLMCICLCAFYTNASADVAIGDTLLFGAYEQDNDYSNGQESIEWIVLEKLDDDMAMVISKYGLDSMPYNDGKGDITWDASSLRRWLNNDFIDIAFNGEEQSAIVESFVKAEKNAKYRSDAGSDTQDQVFLLSCKEAQRFFSTNKTRKATATAYTKAQGAYANDNHEYTWWLRSPGNKNTRADSVYGGGEILPIGVNNAKVMVRPVIWLYLDASSVSAHSGNNGRQPSSHTPPETSSEDATTHVCPVCNGTGACKYCAGGMWYAGGDRMETCPFCWGRLSCYMCDGLGQLSD